jgi:hypothetical protein
MLFIFFLTGCLVEKGVREVTKNHPMVLAVCVKIRPHEVNIQKKLMCFIEQIDLYIVIGQHLAGSWARKFDKRYKYRCKR